MTGALDGIVVADFSRVLAGPYATMLLGDLGADVIKVERPGVGDDTRAWSPPEVDGKSTYFAAINRNKRSVTLDLASEDGAAAARALAARADVLVENLRPGTMARLGLGYEDVRAVNPAVVYCSISGFGSGAGAGLPGYDLLVQAVGGLMSVTGSPDGEPMRAGVAVVDVMTGLHAGLGIVAALHHRERTGEGQLLEVSLMSALLSSMVNQSAAYAVAGVVPHRLGNQHPSVGPYEVFDVSGGSMVLAVGNDRQFVALCDVLDRPDLAADERFATNHLRVTNRDALHEPLAAALAKRTGDEWLAVLTPVGVPCGPINDIAAAFALADSLGLDPIVEIPAGDATVARQVANPVRYSATPATYRLPPPDLGSSRLDDR